MPNNELPLHYAIIKEFADETPKSAQDVFESLQPSYGGYKLFTQKDIEETLATAKENGLLDEVDCCLEQDGALTSLYRINEFGKDMMSRYLP